MYTKYFPTIFFYVPNAVLSDKSKIPSSISVYQHTKFYHHIKQYVQIIIQHTIEPYEKQLNI